jgi:hypothetical protein
MGWSWWAVDLRSRRLLGEVVCERWSSTAKLSDTGEWSALVAPPGDGASAETLRAITTPGRTVLVAVRDGSVVDAGIIWRRRRGEIAGASIASYLDRRTLLAARDHVDVDVWAVVEDLLEWQRSNGGIDIDLATAGTVGAVDQEWRRWDVKNIGEAFRQLAAADPGFEWVSSAQQEPSGPGLPLVWRITAGGRLGRPWPQSHVRFVHGVNADLDLDPDEDATTLTTRATAVGAEIDSVTQERRLQTRDSTLLAGGWPVLDSVLDAQDVRGVFRLASLAAGVIRAAGLEDRGTHDAVVVPDHPLAAWQSWTLGDDAHLQIEPGVDGWWPDGRSVVRRIVARTWSVEPAGEQLTVTFGPRWAA